MPGIDNGASVATFINIELKNLIQEFVIWKRITVFLARA